MKLASTRLTAIGLGIAALALIADQASKSAILAHFQDATDPVVGVAPFLNLVLVANHGVSFGLFNAGTGWQSIVFSVLAVAITCGLVYSLTRTRSP